MDDYPTPYERRVGMVVALLISLALLFWIAGYLNSSFWVWLGKTSRAEWAAWVQALGTLIAVAIAIAVPAWQNARREKVRADERRIFAAAFGIRLAPVISSLHRRVEYRLINLKAAIGQPPYKDTVEVDIGTAIDNDVDFIRRHWNSIARLDERIALDIVGAVTKLDIASGDFTERNRIGGYDEPDGGWVTRHRINIHAAMLHRAMCEGANAYLKNAHAQLLFVQLPRDQFESK